MERKKCLHDSGADMTQTERDESETSLKNCCSQPHALNYFGHRDQDKMMPGNRQSDSASENWRREQTNTIRDGETSSGSEILGPYRTAFMGQHTRPKRHSRLPGGHVMYYKPTINHYSSSLQNGTMQAIDEYCHPPPPPCQERVYHYPCGNTSSQDDGYITNAALRQTSDGYSSQERRSQHPGNTNSQLSDKGVHKGNARTKEEVYGQIIVSPNSIPPIPKPKVQKQMQIKLEMIDNDGKKQTLHGLLACTSVDDDPVPNIDPEDIGPSPHYQVPRNIPVNQTNTSSDRTYSKAFLTPDSSIVNRARVQQEEQHGQTNAIAHGRTVSTRYDVKEKRERPVSDVMNIRRVSGEYNVTAPQNKPTLSNKTPKKHKNITRVSRSVPDRQSDVIHDTSFWQKIGLGKKSNGSHVCPTGELVFSIWSEEKVIEVKHHLRKHGCEGEWFVTEAEHQPTHPYDLHVKISNGKVVSYPIQRIRSSNKEKYTIEDSKNFPCLCKLLEHYSSKKLPNTDNTIRQAFDQFGTVVTEV